MRSAVSAKQARKALTAEEAAAQGAGDAGATAGGIYTYKEIKTLTAEETNQWFIDNVSPNYKSPYKPGTVVTEIIDKNSKLLWQSEDLNKKFPNLQNLPFEQMGIKNNELYASDFYGRNYHINLFDGKVGECNIVK